MDTYARRAGSVTVRPLMAASKSRKANKTRPDLQDRVREPGFTPSVRDIPAIVTLLGERDEELVRDAERALVRLGPTLVTHVREESKRATPEARARLVRAVGSVVSQGEEEAGAAAITWLVEELARGEGRAIRPWQNPPVARARPAFAPTQTVVSISGHS